MTNKVLISNIYKKLKQVNNNNKTSVKKWAEELNRHSSTEEMQMANRHMKRCSTWLIIRETQAQTTISYQLIPIRMPIIKKNTNNKYRQECGEKGTLLHCWWECKLVQPLWKRVRKLLKKQKLKLSYDPAIPLLIICPKSQKH